MSARRPAGGGFLRWVGAGRRRVGLSVHAARGGRAPGGRPAGARPGGHVPGRRQRHRQVDADRGDRGGRRVQRRGRLGQLPVQHPARPGRAWAPPCGWCAGSASRGAGSSCGPSRSTTWPPRSTGSGWPAATAAAACTSAPTVRRFSTWPCTGSPRWACTCSTSRRRRCRCRAAWPCSPGSATSRRPGRSSWWPPTHRSCWPCPGPGSCSSRPRHDQPGRLRRRPAGRDDPGLPGRPAALPAAHLRRGRRPGVHIGQWLSSTGRDHARSAAGRRPAHRPGRTARRRPPGRAAGTPRRRSVPG